MAATTNGPACRGKRAESFHLKFPPARQLETANVMIFIKQND
jgi:hypothetical protein